MASMTSLLFVALFGVALSLPSSFNSFGVCNSAECQDVAKLIKGNLDEDADPCEDFYAFACGGFKNLYPIPQGAQSIKGLDLVAQQVDARQIGLLDDPKLKNHGSKVVRKAKKIYDDCMNDNRENATTPLTGKVFMNQHDSLVPSGMYKSQSLVNTFEEICRKEVNSKYPFVIIRLYLDKFFPITEYKASRDIVMNVWKAFRNHIIKKVPWMDEKTQKTVYKTLDDLKMSIGYPNWLTDDKELDKEYKEEKHPNWRGNVLSVGGTYWIVNPEVVIPAAIFQRQMFNSKIPNYINYGAVGNIIGHEISHGVDFWTGRNNSGKKQAGKCIYYQGETIQEPQTGKTCSGGPQFQVGSQIVADIGGMNASYTAYKTYIKEQEQQLPGLTKYSADQLFFLAQASTWCANSQDDYIKYLMSFGIMMSPYDYYRVVIPALNSPVFAKAYNCKVGSRMNPTHKCILW